MADFAVIMKPQPTSSNAPPIKLNEVANQLDDVLNEAITESEEFRKMGVDTNFKLKSNGKQQHTQYMNTFLVLIKVFS